LTELETDTCTTVYCKKSLVNALHRFACFSRMVAPQLLLGHSSASSDSTLRVYGSIFCWQTWG